MNKLNSLWYTDADGNDLGEGVNMAPPSGSAFQHYRNPCQLTEEIFDLENKCSLMRATMTYASDLVLASTRPNLLEIFRALFRGFWNKPLEFDQAVLVAATSCEACVNVEAYNRGLSWGYRLNSKEWKEARTSCERCRKTIRDNP